MARSSASRARAAAETPIQTLTLEATSANWHLIADLPDAALVVAHFPVAENVSLHLVNGQEPIRDMMMIRRIAEAWRSTGKTNLVEPFQACFSDNCESDYVTRHPESLREG